MAGGEAPDVRGLEAKVNALLILRVDEYLRATGVAKPKPRSIDRLLADAGLSRPAIAKLLGKSRRAVDLMLEEKAEKSTTSK